MNNVLVYATWNKTETYTALKLVYPNGRVETSRFNGIDTIFTDSTYSRDTQEDAVKAIKERFSEDNGYTTELIGYS